MVISRYEFKYYLTEEVAAEVKKRTLLWMDPDKMGGPSGGYQITSLYLDRADWTLARQTWEGVRERFKLRIRFYGHTPETVFAEVKQRVGSTIGKIRSRIPPEYAAALAHNEPLPPDLEAPEFREFAEKLDAVPGLWVRYQREAFTSGWGDGARLTFDRRLEVQIPQDHDFMPRPSMWRIVPIKRPIILEMKFNGAFPSWMRTIAEGLQLERDSCSKYAQGVEQLMDEPWGALRRDTWKTG